MQFQKCQMQLVPSPMDAAIMYVGAIILDTVVQVLEGLLAILAKFLYV